MLINFTNHASSKWSKLQLDAAKEYGEIRELPFPEIDSWGDEKYIDALADKYAAEIKTLNPDAVLCQGEMTFSFAVIQRLLELEIPVLAACSKRESVETLGANGETVKHSVFKFARFRRYQRK
ncbi:hypothetical protein AGMMS49975_08090 [Clostridia bacterium]|nr:hypothetical protein AGMMS49975_08090 [Clostridia bacterium]